jgi:hypothetical protein
MLPLVDEGRNPRRRNKNGLCRVKDIGRAANGEPMGETVPCASGTTIKKRVAHRIEQRLCSPMRSALPAYAERVAERLLRPADELDYRVRRWLRPVTGGTPSPLRIQGSTPRREFLGHIQDAIGRNLRAEYVLEQSMPDRLANLLREFEQQSNKLRPYPETA